MKCCVFNIPWQTHLALVKDQNHMSWKLFSGLVHIYSVKRPYGTHSPPKVHVFGKRNKSHFYNQKAQNSLPGPTSCTCRCAADSNQPQMLRHLGKESTADLSARQENKPGMSSRVALPFVSCSKVFKSEVTCPPWGSFKQQLTASVVACHFFLLRMGPFTPFSSPCPRTGSQRMKVAPQLRNSLLG